MGENNQMAKYEEGDYCFKVSEGGDGDLWITLDLVDGYPLRVLKDNNICLELRNKNLPEAERVVDFLNEKIRAVSRR